MHTRVSALFFLSCALACAVPAAAHSQSDWTFDVDPSFGELPADKKLGATHGGIVVDKAGNFYASSNTNGVFVFDQAGKYLRTIAPDVTNLHGLVLREEGGQEHLYGALNSAGKAVKLALDGTVKWEIGVPRESGIYAQPEDAKKKGAVNFRPTGIALAPDGRIYIADGYGASVIHVFGADRKYLKTIGSRGKGENQFQTCHGIALDTRYGAPRLLVADRENRRLVHLDLDGKWLGVHASDLRRPCSVAFFGDVVAVAELEARVAILDRAGKLLVAVGDNPEKAQWANFNVAPESWKAGVFTAPHGCAFDAAGNLYVQDWNFVGRLTKLKRVGAKKT